MITIFIFSGTDIKWHDNYCNVNFDTILELCPDELFMVMTHVFRANICADITDLLN